MKNLFCLPLIGNSKFIWNRLQFFTVFIMIIIEKKLVGYVTNYGSLASNIHNLQKKKKERERDSI